jgi:hypothetical protein
VAGTVDEIYDILAGGAEYPRWWPAVYLEGAAVAPANASGIGETMDYRVKGWLPLTANLRLHTVAANRPQGFTVESTGDLNGTGVWTLAQHGPQVDITFDWTVYADKPVLRLGSFLLRPLFASNHHWCMAQGEQSLHLLLASRHATSEEQRALLPAPPQPMPIGPVVLVGMLALSMVTGIFVALLGRRGD